MRFFQAKNHLYNSWCRNSSIHAIIIFRRNFIDPTTATSSTAQLGPCHCPLELCDLSLFLGQLGLLCLRTEWWKVRKTWLNQMKRKQQSSDYRSQALWNFRCVSLLLGSWKTQGWRVLILRSTDIMNHDIRVCFQEACRSSAGWPSNLKSRFHAESIPLTGLRLSHPKLCCHVSNTRLLKILAQETSNHFPILAVGKHPPFELFI